jgi:hypothetical protein
MSLPFSDVSNSKFIFKNIADFVLQNLNMEKSELKKYKINKLQTKIKLEIKAVDDFDRGKL